MERNGMIWSDSGEKKDAETMEKTKKSGVDGLIFGETMVEEEKEE